jgi:hypothetical protein
MRKKRIHRISYKREQKCSSALFFLLSHRQLDLRAFFLLYTTIFQLSFDKHTTNNAVNMTSTAADDLSAYYLRTQRQLYIILGSILVSIGGVGGLLTCIVFAQKTMRQNPGSIYFIAYNLTSLILMFDSLFSSVISHILNFNLYSYNVPYCKLYLYGAILFPTLSRYYLVLTSVDRIFVTSSNAVTRQRSTHRLAYWSIAGGTLFISLYYIHLLVLVDIYELYPGYSVCYYRPGNYAAFVNYSNLVVTGFIPWLLLSVFAVLTLRNLHQVRIQPLNAVPAATNSRQSKDRQFAVMLLAEIIIFFLSSAATLIFSIYLQITQYQTKNDQQRAVENFLQNLFYLFSFVPGATTFYVNLAVSKAFRQKTTEVLFELCQHGPIHGGRRQRITRP